MKGRTRLRWVLYLHASCYPGLLSLSLSLEPRFLPILAEPKPSLVPVFTLLPEPESELDFSKLAGLENPAVSWHSSRIFREWSKTIQFGFKVDSFACATCNLNQYYDRSFKTFEYFTASNDNKIRLQKNLFSPLKITLTTIDTAKPIYLHFLLFAQLIIALFIGLINYSFPSWERCGQTTETMSYDCWSKTWYRFLLGGRSSSVLNLREGLVMTVDGWKTEKVKL